MKSAIIGSSGYIGKNLAKTLEERGNIVFGFSFIEIGTISVQNLSDKLRGVDCVFNLVGEPLIKKWNSKIKKGIYDSRIDNTRKIIEAINLLEKKPSLLVSSSSIGYYPSDGIYIESADVTVNTFMGHLCRQWEAEALNAHSDVRVVICRLGILLDKNHGFLPYFVSLSRIGLGGQIANGLQPLSWITLPDLLNIYQYIIDHPEIEGPLNCVAPIASTNKSLARELSLPISKISARFSLKQWLLKITLGDFSDLLLQTQHVEPAKLINLGFQFKYPSLHRAIKYIYKG